MVAWAKGGESFRPGGVQTPPSADGRKLQTLQNPRAVKARRNGFLSLAVALSILASMADDTQPISVDAEENDHDHQPSSHGHRPLDDIWS